MGRCARSVGDGFEGWIKGENFWVYGGSSLSDKFWGGTQGRSAVEWVHRRRFMLTGGSRSGWIRRGGEGENEDEKWVLIFVVVLILIFFLIFV